MTSLSVTNGLSTLVDSVMGNHDESQPVLRMFVDLTVNTPTTPLPVSITAPSALYTQLRNCRGNLTTVVTDGDVRIDFAFSVRG